MKRSVGSDVPKPVSDDPVAEIEMRDVVVLSRQRPGSSELVGRPFLREPASLIKARNAKHAALMKLGCSSKQAWAIAFNHHRRQFLSVEDLEKLGLD